MRIMMTFIAVVTFAPAGAFAAFPADDCPTDFDETNHPCDNPGTDVCTSSSGTWDCSGGFSNSTDRLWAVHGSSDQPITWGLVNGTEFCCISENTETHINIETLLGGDYIRLVTTVDSTRYQWDGTSDIEAGPGVDHIWGSDHDSCGTGWCDYIHPGSGLDETYAGGGDDYIAEPSNDSASNTIYGGSGDDEIWGGNATDYLYGDDDVDELHGGGAKDYIIGGAGVDYLYGDGGEDELCGGTGYDYIYGGAGIDDECSDGVDTFDSCGTMHGYSDGVCHF